MQPFTYMRTNELRTAITAHAAGGELIAGGTDMLQLLKDGVRAPSQLVDINGLPHASIEVDAGGARFGALARMSDIADHAGVIEQFPAISQALLLSASAQVRNMASIGGNLLQRTRCGYFRDVAFEACNKRKPSSGCAAIEGENRMHAILGGSHACVATHASDVAVALVALDATVQLAGPAGERSVLLEEFHTLPGDMPHIETIMHPGEIIVRVDVPAAVHARHSHYLKVRDRSSFEFALLSAAVGMDIHEGRIRSARVAMGGVGTKPWRMRAVEAVLVGLKAEEATWRVAAERAVDSAQPLKGNSFKIEAAQRTLIRALETVAQSQ